MPWWFWLAVIVMTACFVAVVWLCMPEKRGNRRDK